MPQKDQLVVLGACPHISFYTIHITRYKTRGLHFSRQMQYTTTSWSIFFLYEEGREFYISVYSLFLWIVPCVHSVHTLKSKNILDFVQYRLECNCIRYKLCVNITHYGSQRVCCVFIMHKTKARRGQESIKTERYMANLHRTCSPQIYWPY